MFIFRQQESKPYLAYYRWQTGYLYTENLTFKVSDHIQQVETDLPKMRGLLSRMLAHSERWMRYLPTWFDNIDRTFRETSLMVNYVMELAGYIEEAITWRFNADIWRVASEWLGDIEMPVGDLFIRPYYNMLADYSPYWVNQWMVQCVMITNMYRFVLGREYEGNYCVTCLNRTTTHPVELLYGDTPIHAKLCIPCAAEFQLRDPVPVWNDPHNSAFRDRDSVDWRHEKAHWPN